MSRYTELTARAEAHLATAEAAADDPHVAAQCALAAAILAGRPITLRDRATPDLDQYLTDTETSTDPAIIAARAVAAAFQAAAERLDDIDVDDAGFPTHPAAL